MKNYLKSTSPSGKKMFAFIFLFVLGTGIYFLGSLIAVPGISGKADELVFEMSKSEPLSINTTTRKPLHNDPLIRIYGDGRLICSTPTELSAEVTSRVVPRSELSRFFAGLLDAGFSDLEPRYPAGAGEVEGSEWMAVNISGTNFPKKVVVTPFAESKPLGYQKLEKLARDLCEATYEPYQPTSVTVRMEKAGTSNIGGRRALDWRPGTSSFGNLANTADSQPDQILTGDEAKSVYEQFRTNSSRLIYQSGIYYNASMRVNFPEYKPVKFSDGSQLLAGSGIAYAGGDYKVINVWFYASDQALSSSHSSGGSISNDIRNWYTGQVGKSYDYVNSSQPYIVYKGKKTVAQYKSGGYGPIYNMYYNMKAELYSANRAWNLYVQFDDDNDTYTCAGLGGYTGDGGFSISTSFPSYGCTTYKSGGTGKLVAAHELGHGFGLDHTSDSTIMGHGCDTLSGCTLNSGQATYLRNSSMWFNSSAPPPPTNTPPSAPSNLRTTSISNNSISLAWNASTDDGYIQYYELFRSGYAVARPTGTTYVDAGLNPCTSYYYRVRAYDNLGSVSGLSNQITVSTTGCQQQDTTPPSTPANLTVTGVTSTSASLSWSASSDNVGVSGYYVYRDGINVATTAGTTFTNNGLSPNTTYNFNVRAFDAAGNNSPLSNGVSATTSGGGSDTTPPSTPANLRLTGVTHNSIQIAWNASSDNVGVAGYKVYRNGSHIVSTGSTSYSDTGLSSSTSYNYQVRAYDAAGNQSDFSAPISVTTNPAPVSNLLANGDFSSGDIGSNTSFGSVTTLYKWFTFAQSGGQAARTTCESCPTGNSSPYVMLAKDPDPGYFSVAQTVPGQAGKTYTAQAKALHLSGGASYYQRLYLEFLNSSFTRLSASWVQASTSAQSWYTISKSAVAPSGTAYVRVFLYGPDNQGFTSQYDWDDVILVAQ